MITAARSRHIRFTMIIQNFAQLDQVYGKENAETIRGNCGNIIYLITTELKALEEISKMCGEVKSKKDDKTASTPLVTVSDLQRMKQFEVIILRMRKQPFKTKFTPYFKLDWGRKYPEATYPVRQKQEVHTFDIKEFVKAQKKKKLLEMMNAADNSGNAGNGNTEMFGGRNPFAPNNGMGAMRGNPFGGMPQNVNSNPNPRAVNPFAPRGEMPVNNSMNPRGMMPGIQDNNHSIPNMPVDNRSVNANQNNKGMGGFDVDELVRKIDAKIAELEAEEKASKANQEKEKAAKVTVDTANKVEEKKAVEPIHNNENDKSKDDKKSIPEVVAVEEKSEKKPIVNDLVLDDEEDDDEFFDDFFDN